MAKEQQLVCHEHDWGDLIKGTKEQMQGIGLGVGRAFPEEEGGPARELNVIDPRGLRATITLHSRPAGSSAAIFSASIPFPERDIPRARPTPFAPGVTKTEASYYDEYVGSADALVSARVIRSEAHLPGRPGMLKTCVSISRDGVVWPGRTSKPDAFRGAGSVDIHLARTRSGQQKYLVRVRLSAEVMEQRNAAFKLAREKLMAAVPRRPPLIPSVEGAEREALAELGLERTTSGEYRHIQATNVADFRKLLLQSAEQSIDMLWKSVFCCSTRGVFEFELDEEDREELADAFESIRDVVRSASVVRNRKRVAEAERQRLVVEASRDRSLQAFLSKVQT